MKQEATFFSRRIITSIFTKRLLASWGVHSQIELFWYELATVGMSSRINSQVM